MVVPSDVIRFPALNNALRAAVADFIHQGSAPAAKIITDYVNCEHSYINLDNPSFIGGHKALRKTIEERRRERDESYIDANGNAQDSNQSSRDENGRSRGKPSNSKPAEVKAGVPKLGLSSIQDSSSSSNYNNDDIVDIEVDPAPGGNDWYSFLKTDQRQGFMENGILDHHAGQPSPRPPIHKNDWILVDVTRKLVGSYFDVVRRNLQDMVPKAIMHFLVLHCKKGLQNHLIQTLYKDDLIDKLMKEREDIAAKRANAKAALTALDLAMKELDTIPQQLIKRIRLNDDGGDMMIDGSSDFTNFDVSQYRISIPRISTPRVGGMNKQDAHKLNAAARMALKAVVQAQGISSVEEVFGFAEEDLD
eukprot:TRINITY_DN11545_c0_g2_i1.p3 TRINITY_DN11545_c0_g2~~TRINITY_DN11545_c0_g2_i1.p3  ORF type:complete len:363 (+),score=82.95 TRINITY_DN11545_c0_g2_i1:1608-2696(+)